MNAVVHQSRCKRVQMKNILNRSMSLFDKLILVIDQSVAYVTALSITS